VSTARTKKKFATVSFIGGGPGDPGLLTVKAAEILADADVVVAPGELHARLLGLCREDAEFVDAAKSEPVDRAKAMVVAAKDGRRVARIFSGDPTLFCGYATEADVCAKAKVPFELVPGVSAALSVPGYAGVPVTDKKTNAVHIVDFGADAPEPDWAALVAPGSTVILLNCGRRIGKAATALVEHGRKPETPVAVTADGTTTEQFTVVSTLETIDREAAAAGPDALVVVPGCVVVAWVVVVVVGAVVVAKVVLGTVGTKPDEVGRVGGPSVSVVRPVGTTVAGSVEMPLDAPDPSSSSVAAITTAAVMSASTSSAIRLAQNQYGLPGPPPRPNWGSGARRAPHSRQYSWNRSWGAPQLWQCGSAGSCVSTAGRLPVSST